MNRVEELIKELCLDGVVYRRVTDVADYIRGVTYSKHDEQSDGPIAVLRANNITLASNTLNYEDLRRVNSSVKVRENQHLRKNDILICAGSGSKEHIGKVAFLEKDLAATFGGFMGVLRTKGGIEPRFLFHLLTGGEFTLYLGKALSTTTINNLNARVMNGFSVPVPPLEVQREIVRILDAFTQLEMELESELEAELEKRRQQYEHYRDQLLTFTEGRRWTTLGEAAVNLDSLRKPIMRSKRTHGKVPYYGASGIVDYVAGHIFDGDYLLVSEDGANLLARSTPIAFSISGKNWVNNHAHVLKFESYASRRFVELYLNSIDLFPFISGAAQPKLNKANLNAIPIPDPPHDEKVQKVALLDKFDAFVNDLSVGLSAELNARRKQYEYYRDQLLSFKELPA